MNKKLFYLLLSLICLLCIPPCDWLISEGVAKIIIIGCLVMGIVVFIILAHHYPDVEEEELIEINTPELERLQEVLNEIVADDFIHEEEKTKLLQDVYFIVKKHNYLVEKYVESLQYYIEGRKLLKAQPPIQEYEGIHFFDTYLIVLEVEQTKEGVFWFHKPIKIDYDNLLFSYPERYKPNKPAGYIQFFTKDNQNIKIFSKNVERDFEIINLIISQIDEFIKEKSNNSKNQMGF